MGITKQKHRRQQDCPTMEVSNTSKKSTHQSQPASPPINEKQRFPVEEYDEDMRQLIKQLSFQEGVVKEKEKAIRKVLDKMANEEKANEGGHEAKVAKWQKALDDATKMNTTKRREEIEKWEKVKADAIAKMKKEESASTAKQVAKPKKMRKEKEVNQSTVSKDIKKAEKMLNQLAKEEETNAASSEMKHARKMLLRAQQCAQQGNVPSNYMRRARRKLQRLEDELYLARGQVAVTKMSIRNEAETEELKNIFEVREPDGESYEDSYEDDEERFDDDDDEFVIQGNRNNVSRAFCASNLNSHCTPFVGAFSDIMKSAKACNPSECLDL